MALTLSRFANECGNIPPSLVRAVVRQLGGWDSFRESASDVANHGIDCGFHGFVYYTETEAFAKRNRAAIATLAESMADDLGSDGPINLVRGFNCLNPKDPPSRGNVSVALYGGRGGDDDEMTLIRNALAWFAAEEVCRAYAGCGEIPEKKPKSR